jgi:peptidoglycan/LPS O-acetylase OafA/YrhL
MNVLAGAFSLKRNLEYLLDPPRARFRPIDGFRALAVLWIILMHCMWFQYPFMSAAAFSAFLGGAPRWIIGGAYGVDVFFVISGFLIGYLLMDEFSRRGGIRLPRFYGRRFLKLMPAYIAAMALYAVTMRVNRHMLWTNLIYINNFIAGVNQAMHWTWSLAIEEQFYFTFPCFLIFVFYKTRPSHRTGLLWAVIILSLLIRAFVIFHERIYLPVPWSAGVTDARFLHWAETVYIKPYTRFGCMAIGVLATHFQLTGSAARFFQSRPRVAFIGAVSSILLMTSIIAAPIHVAGPRWSDTASLIVLSLHRTLFGAATAFLILFSLYPANRVARLFHVCLSWRPFYSMAQLAYSAYLLHPIILTMMFSAIAPNLGRYPMMVYFVVGPVLSFTGALVLYLLVERPFMNLREVNFSGSQISTRPRAVALSEQV